MGFGIKDRGIWRLFTLKSRVDSFNHESVVDRLGEEIRGTDRSICIDLDQVDFISLPTIRFFNSCARETVERGLGFSIIGGTDKTRRHIEIFGDLKYINLVADFSDLQMEDGTAPTAAQA